MDVDMEEESTQCKLEAEERNQVDVEEEVPFTQLDGRSEKKAPKKLKLRIIAPPKLKKKRKLVITEDVPVPPRKQLPPPPKNCFVCRRLLSSSDASLIDRAHCLFLLNDLMGVPVAQANLHLDQAGRLKNWIGLCGLCHRLIIDGAKDREEIRKLKASIQRRKHLFLSKFRLDLSLKLCGEVNPALKEIGDLLSRVKDHCSSPASGLTVEGEVSPEKIDPPPLAEAEEENEEDEDCLNDSSMRVPPSPTEANVSLATDDTADDTSHTRKIQTPNSSNEEVLKKDRKPLRKPTTNGLYRCPTCPGVRLYNINRIAQHLAIHTRLPYKCSVCHVFLPQDEKQREQHWTDKHLNVQLSPTKDKFLEAKVSPGKFWRCISGCTAAFSSEERRDAHELKCSSAKAMPKEDDPLRYSCSACTKPSRILEEWRLHRVLHHPEMDRISCLYCDTAFGEEGKPRNEEKMLLHIKHHHRRDMPEKRLRSWNRFFFMYQIFDECEPCGLVFATGSQSHGHFKEKHGEPEGPRRGRFLLSYYCPVCRKCYKDSSGLTWHMERNHFLENFICDLCGELFKWLPNLLEHKLRTHALNPGEEFPVYTCNEPGCQYKTVVKSKFAIHSKGVHAPHRSFKCKYCGKGFKSSTQVKEHEKIHENKESKPHQCEICGNSFALKNYLYVHKRLSHEGRTFPSTNKKKGPRNPKAKRTFVTGIDLDLSSANL